ncbi:hypothetical protein KM043_008519 [Ampulex compressa]|nr:hypothetical protein KM043_008519 [Ampulex compressa]
MRKLLQEGVVNTEIIRDPSVPVDIYNNREATHYMELLQLLNSNNEQSTQNERLFISRSKLEVPMLNVTSQTAFGKNVDIHVSKPTERDTTIDENSEDVEHFYDDEYTTDYDIPYDEYEDEDYAQGTTMEFYDYEEDTSIWKQRTNSTTSMSTVGQDIDILEKTVLHIIATESELPVSTEVSITFSTFSSEHDVDATELMKSYVTTGMHLTGDLLTQFSIEDDTLKTTFYESITTTSTLAFVKSTVPFHLKLSTLEFTSTPREQQDNSTSMITLIETKAAMDETTETLFVTVEEKPLTSLYSSTEYNDAITSSTMSITTINVSMETRSMQKQTIFSKITEPATISLFTSQHTTAHIKTTEIFTSTEPFKSKIMPLLEISTQWTNFTEIYDQETTFFTALPAITTSNLLTSTEIQFEKSQITTPTETSFLTSIFAPITTYKYEETEAMSSIGTDSTEVSETALSIMLDQKTTSLEITSFFTVLPTIKITFSTPVKTELTESQITSSTEIEFVSSQFTTEAKLTSEKIKTITMSTALSTGILESVTTSIVTESIEESKEETSGKEASTSITTGLTKTTDEESTSHFEITPSFTALLMNTTTFSTFVERESTESLTTSSTGTSYQVTTETTFSSEETKTVTMSTESSMGTWENVTSIAIESTEISEVETSTFVTISFTETTDQEITSFFEFTESQITSLAEIKSLTTIFTTVQMIPMYTETKIMHTSSIDIGKDGRTFASTVSGKINETDTSATEMYSLITSTFAETFRQGTMPLTTEEMSTMVLETVSTSVSLVLTTLGIPYVTFTGSSFRTTEKSLTTTEEIESSSYEAASQYYDEEVKGDYKADYEEEESTKADVTAFYDYGETTSKMQEQTKLFITISTKLESYEIPSTLSSFITERETFTTSLLEEKSTLISILSTESYKSSPTFISLSEDMNSTSVSVEKSTYVTDSSQVFITGTKSSSSLELSTSVSAVSIIMSTESTTVEIPSEIPTTVTEAELTFSSTEKSRTSYFTKSFESLPSSTSTVETFKTEPSLPEIFTFSTTMASDKIISPFYLNVSALSIETTLMITDDVFALTTTSEITFSKYESESSTVTPMLTAATFSSSLSVDITIPPTLITESILTETELWRSTPELSSEGHMSSTEKYMYTKTVQTTTSVLEKTEILFKTSQSATPLVTDYQFEKTSSKTEHYTTQEEVTTFEYFYDAEYATEHKEVYEEDDYEDENDTAVSEWYDYEDQTSGKSSTTSTTSLISTTSSVLTEITSSIVTTKTFLTETVLTLSPTLNLSSAETEPTTESKIPEKITTTTELLKSEVFSTEVSGETLNISTGFHEETTTIKYSSLKYSTIMFTTYEFEKENKTIGELSLPLFITTPAMIETTYFTDTKSDVFYSTYVTDVTLYSTATIAEIEPLSVLSEAVFTTLPLLETSTEKITFMPELSTESFDITTTKTIFDTLLSPVTVENISLLEILNTTLGISLFTTEKLISQSSTINDEKEKDEEIKEQLIEQLNEVDDNEQNLAQREDELREEEQRWEEEKRKRIAEIRKQKMQQMRTSTDISLSTPLSESIYSTTSLYDFATSEVSISTFAPVLIPPTEFDYVASSTLHGAVESDLSNNIETLKQELEDRTKELNDREARILERERLLQEDKEHFENKVREIMENDKDFRMEDLEELEEEIKHQKPLEYTTMKQTTGHTFYHENVTLLYQSTLHSPTEEYTTIVETTDKTLTTSRGTVSDKYSTTDKDITTRICLNVLKGEVPFPARNANALMIKEVCLPMFSLDKNTLQLPHNVTSKFPPEIKVDKAKIRPADKIYRIKNLRLKNNEWAEPTLPSKGHKLQKFVRFYKKFLNLPSKSVTATSVAHKRNVGAPPTKSYRKKGFNNLGNLSWITKSNQFKKIDNMKFTDFDNLVRKEYKSVNHETNYNKSNDTLWTRNRLTIAARNPWDYKKIHGYGYDEAKQTIVSTKSIDGPKRHVKDLFQSYNTQNAYENYKYKKQNHYRQEKGKGSKQTRLKRKKAHNIDKTIIQNITIPKIIGLEEEKFQQKGIVPLRRQNTYISENTFHSLDNNEKVDAIPRRKSKTVINPQTRGRLGSIDNTNKYSQKQKSKKASEILNFMPLPYDFKKKRNNLKEEVETWPTEKVTRHHVGGTRFWKSELIVTESWNDEKERIAIVEKDNLQDVVTDRTCLYAIFTSERSTQNKRPSQAIR